MAAGCATAFFLADAKATGTCFYACVAGPVALRHTGAKAASTGVNRRAFAAVTATFVAAITTVAAAFTAATAVAFVATAHLRDVAAATAATTFRLGTGLTLIFQMTARPGVFHAAFAARGPRGRRFRFHRRHLLLRSRLYLLLSRRRLVSTIAYDGQQSRHSRHCEEFLQHVSSREYLYKRLFLLCFGFGFFVIFSFAALYRGRAAMFAGFYLAGGSAARFFAFREQMVAGGFAAFFMAFREQMLTGGAATMRALRGATMAAFALLYGFFTFGAAFFLFAFVFTSVTFFLFAFLFTFVAFFLFVMAAVASLVFLIFLIVVLFLIFLIVAAFVHVVFVCCLASHPRKYCRDSR